MTDSQLVNLLGIDDTLPMLVLREQMKAQLSPESYAENMAVHKSHIKQVVAQCPGTRPIEAAEAILDLLDQDKTLEDGQREIWKAICAIAAFEMQEMNL